MGAGKAKATLLGEVGGGALVLLARARPRQQEAVLAPLNAKERATLVTLLSKIVSGQPSVGSAEL